MVGDVGEVPHTHGAVTGTGVEAHVRASQGQYNGGVAPQHLQEPAQGETGRGEERAPTPHTEAQA
jgi:hypothetical protein